MMDEVDILLGMEELFFYEDDMFDIEMSDIINEETIETAISSSEGSPGEPISPMTYSPTSGEEIKKRKTGTRSSKKSSKKTSMKSVPDTIEKAIKQNEKAASPEDAFLPPCRVCADKASGLHYGVNTCEACKGFFRRSIVKIQQNGDNYKCIGNGKCKLGPGKRNACAACRYERCLDVGMSLCAIKTGRYTYEKRTQDTVEVKKLKGKENLESDIYVSDDEVNEILSKLNGVIERISPHSHLVFDEEFNLRRQERIYLDHQAKIDTFGTMSVIPKAVWDEFYKETGIDLDNRQELMKSLAKRMEFGLTVMVDFVRTIPGFSDLSVSDQTTLIKASHFEFWFIVQHKAVNPDLKVVSGFLQMHVEEMAKVIEKNLIEAVFQFSRSLKKINLTRDETTLIRGIIVTFRDRCDLEEPEKVEKIQWKLLNCLRVLAKRNNMYPEMRLCQILDRLTALRNLTDLSKEMDKEKCTWPIMKEHPLVLDILGS